MHRCKREKHIKREAAYAPLGHAFFHICTFILWCPWPFACPFFSLSFPESNSIAFSLFRRLNWVNCKPSFSLRVFAPSCLAGGNYAAFWPLTPPLALQYRWINPLHCIPLDVTLFELPNLAASPLLPLSMAASCAQRLARPPPLLSCLLSYPFFFPSRPSPPVLLLAALSSFPFFLPALCWINCCCKSMFYVILGYLVQPPKPGPWQQIW